MQPIETWRLLPVEQQARSEELDRPGLTEPHPSGLNRAQRRGRRIRSEDILGRHESMVTETQ